MEVGRIGLDLGSLENFRFFFSELENGEDLGRKIFFLVLAIISYLVTPLYIEAPLENPLLFLVTQKKKKKKQSEFQAQNPM